MCSPAPEGILGIIKGNSATQTCACQPFNFNLAAGGCQWLGRRGADDFSVIPVSNDYPAAIGAIIVRFQRTAIKTGRQSPIEPVAMFEIIGPFVVAQQITPTNLDFDDDNPALGGYICGILSSDW